MADESSLHPRSRWGRQVDPRTLIHFAIRNGTHVVWICNPSVLASKTSATSREDFVTCVQCRLALVQDEENELKREVHRKLNDEGNPRK